MTLRLLSRLADPIVSLIYPRKCLSCSAPVDSTADGPACGDCWSETTVFSHDSLICSKCGISASYVIPGIDPSCGECGDQHFDTARSIGSYQKALAATIIYMKETPRLPLRARKVLLSVLDGFDLATKTIVIPVPLSKQRRLERGFNQAEIIAAAVARHTAFQMDVRSLVRRIDIPMHRAAMDKKAREASVKNAFEVVRPNLIEGKDVLLIDDVMTSGATASQCARILKKHGAGRVIVLTLARAELRK